MPRILANPSPSDKLSKLLATARRIHAQQRRDKNKIYSVRKPEVECIAKGKAGKRYEFGNPGWNAIG